MGNEHDRKFGKEEDRITQFPTMAYSILLTSLVRPDRIPKHKSNLIFLIQPNPSWSLPCENQGPSDPGFLHQLWRSSHQRERQGWSMLEPPPTQNLTFFAAEHFKTGRTFPSPCDTSSGCGTYMRLTRIWTFILSLHAGRGDQQLCLSDQHQRMCTCCLQLFSTHPNSAGLRYIKHVFVLNASARS